MIPGFRRLLVVSVLMALATPVWAQDEPAAVFKSSVDMVSMAAVVRDARGKIVPSLRREDFEIFDAGKSRPIVDLRTELAAPASVALLVDGSGSMKVGAANDLSQRDIATAQPRLHTDIPRLRAGGPVACYWYGFEAAGGLTVAVTSVCQPA